MNSFAVVCLLPHRLHPGACPNHNRCPGLRDKRTSCKICKALNMCMFAANRFAFEQKTKTSVAETCSGSRLSRSAKAASDRCFSGCAFAKETRGFQDIGRFHVKSSQIPPITALFWLHLWHPHVAKCHLQPFPRKFPPTTESASLKKTFD